VCIALHRCGNVPQRKADLCEAAQPFSETDMLGNAGGAHRLFLFLYFQDLLVMLVKRFCL
jgi:hypothetical protein